MEVKMASGLKDQADKPSRKEAEDKKDDLQTVSVKWRKRHGMNQHWWQQVETGQAVSGQGPQFLFFARNVLDSLLFESIVPNLISYYLSSHFVQLKWAPLHGKDIWHMTKAEKCLETSWYWLTDSPSSSPLPSFCPRYYKSPKSRSLKVPIFWDLILRHRSSPLIFLLRSHL